MTAKTSGIENSPIAWFYMLEDARRRNNFEQAARAERELRRLGVVVRYIDNTELPPKKGRGE